MLNQKKNASLYTYTPTHANALQLLQMDNGRYSQDRIKLQIDRLLDKYYLMNHLWFI